jgi:hypothetical protein
MTVIALFESLQVAISDVLVTVDDGSVSTVTPTTGDTANLPNLGIGVSRLVRKIVTADGPTGRAQLLVAGTLSHIEHFATILRQVFRDQRPLPDELRQLVRVSGAYGCMHAAARLADADGYKEFEVVGVAGNQMCTHTFDVNRINAEVPYFGKVWIAGSGAKNLLRWLQLRGERYAKEFAHRDSEETRYHVANCVGLFLMEEDAGPLLRTLRIGVGGYYEAFTVSQGTLTPIGDCITIFADIIGRNRDRTVSIRRLLYHCYRSQHLYVFSVLQEVVISAASPAKIPLTACKLFDVPVIEPEVELSPWTIHRVASQMSGAKNIRTVMRKEIAGQPATKRFMTNTRDHQLVKVTLSGDHLVISLDEAALQYFASRFPPNLADAIMV